MESFWLAFGAVFPMFCYMALGKLIGKLGFLHYDEFRRLNLVIFEFFIPCMLFSSIYKSDFRAAMDIHLVLELITMVLVVFVSAWAIVPRFVKRPQDASVIIQGAYRSNYALFGMLLAGNIYPGEDLGMIAAMAAFVVPLYNILAVILFESFRGGKVTLRAIATKILHNNLVLAGALGTFFALSGLRLPQLLTEVLSDVGDVALLMALVCMGGMLSFSSVMHDWRMLAMSLSARLVIVPLVAVTVFALLGYRDLALVAVLAISGAPNAVAGAPMADAMGANGALAGEIVAASSAFSIVTIFLFVFAMRNLGLIC